MPLKHTKRTDYLRRQRRTNYPQDVRFKVPIVRRDALEKPEEEQKTLEDLGTDEPSK